MQHDPFTRRITSLEAYLKHLTEIRMAFPDLVITPRDLVAEGDRVAVRWSCAGTHRAPLGGLPPTGRRVAFDGMSVYRVADGRIVEIWTSWDTIGYLRQLDALPGLMGRG